MRRLVFAFAALAALCHVSTARASDPGVSWYGANSSWNGGDIGVSYFEYELAEGNPNKMAFGIAEDGSFSGVAWQAFKDVFSGDPQMTMAITALEKSLQAQVMAKNIATGLDNLAVVATDAGGSEVAVKVVRSDAVSTGGKPVSTADSFDARPKVDGRTLSKAADGRLSMFGADTATSSEDDFFAYPEFFVPALFKGDGNNLCWLRYGGWDGSALSLGERGDGAKALTLAGWHGGATNECGSTVAEILTEEDGANRKAHSVLTRYDDGSGPRFHYVPFGDRVEASAKVDGKSITTNTTDGAVANGEASLYGYASASDWAMPRKHGDGADGTLDWKTPDELCGVSIEWGEVGGGKKLDVIGANAYAGKHSRHYFGTSADTSAALGWHELPNVTTNYVAGDEVTISTNPSIPGRTPAEGEKLVGLKGWNYGYRGLVPLFLANVGGAPAYLPVEGGGGGCGCTNAWAALADWIGDGTEAGGTNGVEFADESLYRTIIHAGFIDQVDDLSLGRTYNEKTDRDTISIKGFAEGEACDASLTAMLADPSVADAGRHLVLTRYQMGDGFPAFLHYLPIGDIALTAKPDESSVTTNKANGASANGGLSLYGWANAADGKVPVKRSGVLSWEDAGTPPDGVTLATVDVTGNGGTTSKAMAVKGFAEAGANTMPYKTDSGTLAWGAPFGTNTVILAGAGINVTANGEGAVTISAQGLSDGGSSSGGGIQAASYQLNVVTDVRYDATTHKFQKKVLTVTIYGEVGEEGGWLDVFEAVSHASEHGAEATE